MEHVQILFLLADESKLIYGHATQETAQPATRCCCRACRAAAAFCGERVHTRSASWPQRSLMSTKGRQPRSRSVRRIDKPSIEATAKLHEAPRLLRLAPRSVHLVTREPHLRAGVKSVEHLVLRKRVRPRDAKLLIEFGLPLLGWVEVLRERQAGFVGNGVVVIVDQLLAPDGRAVQLTLLHNFDTLLLKGLLHQSDGWLSDGVRLDEDESRVRRERRHLSGCTRKASRLRQAIRGVHVLQGIKDGPLLAIFDGDLRILRPRLDRVLRNPSGEHRLCES